jgi:hypothetical protein
MRSCSALQASPPRQAGRGLAARAARTRRPDLANTLRSHLCHRPRRVPVVARSTPHPVAIKAVGWCYAPVPATRPSRTRSRSRSNWAPSSAVGGPVCATAAANRGYLPAAVRQPGRARERRLATRAPGHRVPGLDGTPARRLRPPLHRPLRPARARPARARPARARPARARPARARPREGEHSRTSGTPAKRSYQFRPETSGSAPAGRHCALC